MLLLWSSSVFVITRTLTDAILVIKVPIMYGFQQHLLLIAFLIPKPNLGHYNKFRKILDFMNVTHFLRMALVKECSPWVSDTDNYLMQNG